MLETPCVERILDNDLRSAVTATTLGYLEKY